MLGVACSAAKHDGCDGGYNALLPGICNWDWSHLKCFHPDLRQPDQPGKAFCFCLNLAWCASSFALSMSGVCCKAQV